MTTRLMMLGLALALTGCMRLDVFLFNGQPAEPDENLMERATGIPSDLVAEIDGIVTADGVAVNAYLAFHREDDGTPRHRHGIGLLYCHGNARNIDEYAPRVELLWELGYTVLIFDYPGYGKMPGPSSEEGSYAAARAARSWLESREDLQLSAERVGLYGWSLGAAVCARLAAEEPARALALETPFASVKLLANGSAGVEAPGEWFADSTMDNLATIPAHEGALLVMAGGSDTFVKPAFGRMVHEAAEGHANPNLYWEVPGARHGTVPCVGHAPAEDRNRCEGGWSEEYRQRVTAFFDAAFGAGG